VVIERWAVLFLPRDALGTGVDPKAAQWFQSVDPAHLTRISDSI